MWSQQNYLILLLIVRYFESSWGCWPRDPPYRKSGHENEWMAQFLLKLLLKQRILAVYLYYQLASELLTAKLHSLESDILPPTPQPCWKQWHSKPKSLWGYIFYFRLTTLFCLGYRLSKHKMTRYSKNLGGLCGPLAAPIVGNSSISHSLIKRSFLVLKNAFRLTLDKKNLPNAVLVKNAEKLYCGYCNFKCNSKGIFSKVLSPYWC